MDAEEQELRAAAVLAVARERAEPRVVKVLQDKAARAHEAEARAITLSRWTG